MPLLLINSNKIKRTISPFTKAGQESTLVQLHILKDYTLTMGRTPSLQKLRVERAVHLTTISSRLMATIIKNFKIPITSCKRRLLLMTTLWATARTLFLSFLNSHGAKMEKKRGLHLIPTKVVNHLHSQELVRPRRLHAILQLLRIVNNSIQLGIIEKTDSISM
jgi:hypothetical protein